MIKHLIITIYAPMIYAALCIMLWMLAYPLREQVGGGRALEIESFLGPVKWLRAERRVLFGAQKTCINHRCIGGFMHKMPTREVSGPILWGWRSR